MRTLAFDGRMGASGDMLLAALLAAGADPDALNPIERNLGVTYRIGEVEKSGIAARRVDVLVDPDGVDADRDVDAADPGHDDPRDHDHHDHGGGGHDHDHHDRAEGHGPHRSYREVIDVVEDMDLPESVETDAKTTFGILGEAEAAVHGTDLDATLFHEVGADDAIADVVGTALLIDDLDPDRIVTTPLATGGGEVETSHGTYPVPTPAVVEIAERADWSLRGGPIEAELLTPTGAAILAHAAEGVDTLPALRVGTSGYGAGDYDIPEHPNVLRAILGEGDAGLRRERIAVLETNLDDASPEMLGGLQTTLAKAGALDVSIVPTTMKKSRPGHLVKVIARPEDRERVARRLAEETGTLGVREAGARHRWVADRDIETATVEAGGAEFEVAVKIASADGEVYDVSAEFDDALAVARETDLPVRSVVRRAEATVRQCDSTDRSSSHTG
jgi:uncharacterized protein (TIGR00299 family) protein